MAYILMILMTMMMLGLIGCGRICRYAVNDHIKYCRVSVKLSPLNEGVQLSAVYCAGSAMGTPCCLLLPAMSVNVCQYNTLRLKL